jgi:hypothetical protein
MSNPDAGNSRKSTIVLSNAARKRGQIPSRLGRHPGFDCQRSGVDLRARLALPDSIASGAADVRTDQTCDFNLREWRRESSESSGHPVGTRRKTCPRIARMFADCLYECDRSLAPGFAGGLLMETLDRPPASWMVRREVERGRASHATRSQAGALVVLHISDLRRRWRLAGYETGSFWRNW